MWAPSYLLVEYEVLLMGCLLLWLAIFIASPPSLPGLPDLLIFIVVVVVVMVFRCKILVGRPVHSSQTKNKQHYHLLLVPHELGILLCPCGPKRDWLGGLP